MALVVNNLVKKYGDFTAVDNLSFSIGQPGVFALLGTNGAGKTTSIRAILGMLTKEDGSVTWKGKDLSVVEEKVGYLAEERGLYAKYTIWEQMLYFAELKGMKRAAATVAIKYWLERLGAYEHIKKRAEQLSKGNQQKVQLAAALIADPELLILDEPLSGLDPVNTDLFKSVIREEIDKGKYIIMSSHQMPTVEEFCTEIVIMHKGRVALQGNLNHIKKGYGRIKLSVKADEDILPLALDCGLVVERQTPNETDFRVGDSSQPEMFLKKALELGITVVKYELREPTLHEIFVEKADGQVRNPLPDSEKAREAIHASESPLAPTDLSDSTNYRAQGGKNNVG
ncbi:MAG: ATP-binding cassette domain-containing protein [Oscillospiraceae bacterium]|nr:ATP-binding cassette domain-containing protein [Oscillospiraceae bacterium]